MNKCRYCDLGFPLVVEDDGNKGIALHYKGNRMVAYGYDIHGAGSDGLSVRINYCPMCGKDLRGRYGPRD